MLPLPKPLDVAAVARTAALALRPSGPAFSLNTREAEQAPLALGVPYQVRRQVRDLLGAVLADALPDAAGQVQVTVRVSLTRSVHGPTLGITLHAGNASRTFALPIAGAVAL